MESNMNNKNVVTNNSKKIFYIDNAPIFKFINPNSNNKLSELKGLDLQDLIVLIDDYYIRLRNELGFEQNITFGLELEFENAKRDKIKEQLNKTFQDDDWIIKRDSSLHNGAEINSPILTDNKITWKNLDKVCSIVEPLASIGIKSGGHIHIGTQTLGSDRNSWLNFIKLWSVYENIIFRFAYGEFLKARPYISKYAKPVSRDFWNDYVKLDSEHASLEAIISKISHEKDQAVNFNNVSKNDCDNFNTKNTIEFRCPNGTLNPAIWQNNVNLFVKVLCYSKSTLFDDDLVQQRYQLNLDQFTELKWYDEIYLDQALELCDMLFSNNFDKIYFLKQYLKVFQVVKHNTSYPKTYTLTKRRY